MGLFLSLPYPSLLYLPPLQPPMAQPNTPSPPPPQPSSVLTVFPILLSETSLDRLFLPYIGCVFIISFLLLLYVSGILGFMCYLVWFARLFFGSGNTQKFFLYKWTAIASLLYAISAYKRFHRNALLSDGGETCLAYIWTLTWKRNKLSYCLSHFQLALSYRS